MNIIERHFNKRARLAKLRAQAGKTKRARFVVICDKPAQRAVGVYTSFKKADGDATAWGGYVLILRTPDEELQHVSEGGRP
jgi:hypothetical protein